MEHTFTKAARRGLTTTLVLHPDFREGNIEGHIVEDICYEEEVVSLQEKVADQLSQ